MAQLVNSQDSFGFDIEEARSLIENGRFDRYTKTSGSVIQDGKVFYSALGREVSRANGESRSVLGGLISMIDKSKEKNGGTSVDKEEAITLLSNLIANGKEKIQDIAQALGIKIRNAQDEANEATALALNAKLGDKPLEEIDAMIGERSANQAVAIEGAVTAAAGPKLIQNAARADIENPAHSYAAQRCAGLSGEALKSAVEALKKDPVLVALNMQRADGDSPLLRVQNGGKTAPAGAGIPVLNV